LAIFILKQWRTLSMHFANFKILTI
jgi:hypothetical protein